MHRCNRVTGVTHYVCIDVGAYVGARVCARIYTIIIIGYKDTYIYLCNRSNDLARNQICNAPVTTGGNPLHLCYCSLYQKIGADRIILALHRSKSLDLTAILRRWVRADASPQSLASAPNSVLHKKPITPRCQTASCSLRILGTQAWARFPRKIRNLPQGPR